LTGRIGEAAFWAFSFPFMTHTTLKRFLFAPEQSNVKMHKHTNGFMRFLKIRKGLKTRKTGFFLCKMTKDFTLKYILKIGGGKQ